MAWTSIYFKGEVITRSETGWHVDFREFKRLYGAKGHVLRKIKCADARPPRIEQLTREIELRRAA